MKRKADCLDSSSCGIPGSTAQSFEPIVCGVQLVGDSMLLRLSRYIARKSAQSRSGTSSNSSRDEQRDKPYWRTCHSTMRRRLGTDSSINSVATAYNTSLINSSSTDTQKNLKTLHNSTIKDDVMLHSTTEINIPMVDSQHDCMENKTEQNNSMELKTEKRFSVQAGEITNETAYMNTQTVKNTPLTLKDNMLKIPDSENLRSPSITSTSMSKVYSPSHSMSDSVDELMNRSSTDSVNQSVDDSINKSVDDSINKSVSDSLNESVSDSLNEIVTESIDESVNESIDESVNESIDEFVNESIDESVNNSVDKFVNDSINKIEDEAVNVVSSKTLDKSLKTKKVSRPTAKPEPIYLCISGQFLCQLSNQLEQLEQQQPPVKMVQQVLLMCGTNDLKRRNCLHFMQKYMENIVRILKKFTSEVVVLTLPPIPACKTAQDYNLLRKFNDFLKTQLSGVTIVDIYPLFVNSGKNDRNETIREDLFEKYIGNPRMQRTDLVHWNAYGMDIIHSHLCEIGIFEKTRLQEQEIKDKIVPKIFLEQKVKEEIAQHVLFQQEVIVEKMSDKILLEQGRKCTDNVIQQNVKKSEIKSLK